jgi:hypothetical protein
MLQKDVWMIFHQIPIKRAIHIPSPGQYSASMAVAVRVPVDVNAANCKALRILSSKGENQWKGNFAWLLGSSVSSPLSAAAGANGR